MVTATKRNNLKKKDIANNIFINMGIPVLYSNKIVNDIIEILTNNIKLKKHLKIKNFGSFSVNQKNKRPGRNPKNKEKYEIKERLVVTFKGSNYLKRKFNKNA